MNAATTASIWPVLWPVIVGGLIAVIGAGIGPFITHLLTSRAARVEKRQKLFESMLAALFEFDHWLNLKKDSYVFGKGRDLPYSPISKAIAVALMYFPEALPALRDIEIKGHDYQKWMTEASLRRLSGQIETLNDGFEEAYKPYTEAMIRFQASIPKMVSQHRL